MNITLSKAQLPKSEYQNLYLEHLLVTLVMTHPPCSWTSNGCDFTFAPGIMVLRAHAAWSQSPLVGVRLHLMVMAPAWSSLLPDEFWFPLDLGAVPSNVFPRTYPEEISSGFMVLRDLLKFPAKEGNKSLTRSDSLIKKGLLGMGLHGVSLVSVSADCLGSCLGYHLLSKKRR